MTRAELDALKAAIRAQKQVAAKFPLLSSIATSVVGMWDELSTVSKTTITRVLPRLAEMVEAMREFITGEEG